MNKYTKIAILSLSSILCATLLWAASTKITTYYGGIGAGDSVRLQSTKHATKGKIYIGSGTSYYFDDVTKTWIPAAVYASPAINKGPAIITSFVGTVTATASTTVTFSSAADAILAGYSATNPVLGTTLISNALTRYIVSWNSATECVVDSAVTWAETAITSVQLPIATFVDSAGVTQGWMNAAGNVVFRSGMNIGTTPLIISSAGSTLSVHDNLVWQSDYGIIFDIDADNNSTSQTFQVRADGGSPILLNIDEAGNVMTGGLTAAGTSAAKNVVIGEGTLATATVANTTHLASKDFNGASSNRLHTLTEEGQSAALATINETAIFYGVTWDESADTYTRTGRTTGHKVAATLPAGMLPIQEAMRGCLLADAGTVNYYLSATDWTKKEDGATASVLTGADGQVMVEIPKFWYRYKYSGTVHTWEVSPVAMSGFAPHPAFYKDGAWVDNRYIGAYEGVLYDTSLTAYVDGLHQTAVSAVFATADDSITIATRSNWASNLTVGQEIVVSGTVSNNGTLTVASIVDGTAITVDENLTNETHAATVISTVRDYTATTGDKLSSVSGKAAITYLTRDNARVIALTRGAGWRQLDYDLVEAIQLLILTEYASFYTQSVIGAGISAVTDWAAYNDYNPLALSGNGNSIGNATGNNAGSTSSATESTKYLKYRGIENLYGHLWKWVDGFNINGNIPYRTNSGTDFADDTATAYTRMVDVNGADVTLHNGDGYPATIQKMKWGFLAASVGADGATKLTDYYYQSSGWRVALFGGHADAGVSGGAFFWSLADASSGLSRAIGARVGF